MSLQLSKNLWCWDAKSLSWEVFGLEDSAYDAHNAGEGSGHMTAFAGGPRPRVGIYRGGEFPPEEPGPELLTKKPFFSWRLLRAGGCFWFSALKQTVSLPCLLRPLNADERTGHRLLPRRGERTVRWQTLNCRLILPPALVRSAVGITS